MKKENITSTQKGVIAEHIVANELMIETDGRFSPFSPLADDEGIDLLIYDKKTGNALPIQIKSRTRGIIKKGKEIPRLSATAQMDELLDIIVYSAAAIISIQEKDDERERKETPRGEM